jgi:hypothetical protein
MVGLISLVVAAHPRRERAFAALRFIASSKTVGVSPGRSTELGAPTEFCRTSTHPALLVLKALATARLIDAISPACFQYIS